MLTGCVTTKNGPSRHQGVSPAQHVLGKRPRAPGSVTGEPESKGTTWPDMTRRAHFTCDSGPEWKQERRSYTWLDASRTVAKVLQRNAAPVDAKLYDVGDLVIYRRDEANKRILAITLHENVLVLVNARKLRPANEIEVAAHHVQAQEPVLH